MYDIFVIQKIEGHEVFPKLSLTEKADVADLCWGKRTNLKSVVLFQPAKTSQSDCGVWFCCRINTFFICLQAFNVTRKMLNHQPRVSGELNQQFKRPRTASCQIATVQQTLKPSEQSLPHTPLSVERWCDIAADSLFSVIDDYAQCASPALAGHTATPPPRD